MIDYAEVLTRRHPGRLWSLNANDYEQLTMLDDGPKPSKASLEAAWPEVAQEIAAHRDALNAARASAIAKLSSLGLSDDEIKALVG